MRRTRGFTLIEAVLVLAIGLGLIVGGVVFFQQARFATKAYDTSQLISSLALGLTEEGRRRGSFQTVNAASADSLGLITPGNYDGTDVRHPFGGTLVISSESPFRTLSLTLNDLDRKVCDRLFGLPSQGTLGVVQTRATEIIVNGSSFRPGLDAIDPGLCEDREDNTAEIVLR